MISALCVRQYVIYVWESMTFGFDSLYSWKGLDISSLSLCLRHQELVLLISTEQTDSCRYVVLCAPFWKRGQKVNVRWPRSGSRWRTRPDADLARTHFHCCSGSDRRRKYLQYFFRIVSKVFLSAYSETQFCCGTNIRPGGEEEVKTMNEEPRKLMHWEDPCSIENDQNLFNLIRRELGAEVERPLCGYLGHGGHEEAVLLLLAHWQDLKPPSLSAEYRSLITAFSSFETVFDVVSCWIKLSLWTLL